MNALEQLKKYTVVVADTGDFNSIKSFMPRDATTNPSLILKAVRDPQYISLMDEAISYAKSKSENFDTQLAIAIDKVVVNFGNEILKIVPGRVSSEVDSRLSFNTEATVTRARNIIKLYEEIGVDKSQVLIKIASTWEGIKAAEILEKEGIHCNLTLLFNKIQAVACAEAGVKLISPFVGRIYDWHKKNRGVDHIEAHLDPGVQSVTDIFNYYKKFGYQTEVMGASFRNMGEIIELAGCDLLTISPNLLAELEESKVNVIPKLVADNHKQLDIEKLTLTESEFRWLMNEDVVATEKLAEGIRNFAKDIVSLEKMLAEKLKE
ncbi:transaldolase [Plebeiibacterium sediminum]|uniref:Transaldolase n=1 Tax=Plebeiibacterium sediminum TaxID=2992112 RepID=A0AAE3M8U6_9BACT|nr:transaldolase [Plebeiobacterium sediminum]MCW3789126.1 transaldolase [Plebeiobacterium sediminum]